MQTGFRFNSGFKTAVCVGMSAFLTNAPQVALAKAEMIPNRVIVNGESAEKSRENLQALLNEEEVLVQLQKYGVSADEAKARVASLTPAELNQFSQQIEQAKAGGNILITVVLVLLIIFLVQRI